jgi:hypothetical protein
MQTYDKVPFHVGILLFILKTLHYTLGLVSNKTYVDYKRYVFNNIMLDKRDAVFFLMKQR